MRLFGAVTHLTLFLGIMKLSYPSKPSESDFESLKQGLNNYNELFTGEVYSETVASFVKDENGCVLGGILGEIDWDWMYIRGLWIDEKIRKDGWGSRLLHSLEHYAATKDVYGVRLETTTFQALDFYLKNNYSVFAELENMPKGHTSYFLNKVDL